MMNPIEFLITFVKDSYWTHSRANAINVCSIQIVVCTLLLPIFRPFFYRYYRSWIDSVKPSEAPVNKSVDKPIESTGDAPSVEATKETKSADDGAKIAKDDANADEDEEIVEKEVSRGEWWFNILYTGWVIFTLLFLVPYTMLGGAITWLCYWAYAGQVVFFCSTLICDQCGYLTLKKYLFRVVLPMAHSTMLVANSLYMYYGLVQWNMSYSFSHFVPPLVLYFYIFYNGEFYTEDVNPLDTWLGSWTWYSLGSVELVVYRWYVTPAWVYEIKRMEWMYEVATILPVIGNSCLLAWICYSHYYHLKQKKLREQHTELAEKKVQ